MHPHLLSVGLMLLLTAPSAGAGVILRQLQLTEGSNADANGRQLAQVWIEGARTKVVFEESDDPLMPAGTYLLAPGPDVVYLVNPARRTIARLGMAEMEPLGEKDQEAAERAPEAGGPKLEVVGLRLEQKLDEPGPSLLGFPTRHYRYELSYVERQRLRGMSATFNFSVQERHEFWATAALKEAPAARILRAHRIADAWGEARREVEEAEARLYAQGFILKHLIERDTTSSIVGDAGIMRMMPGMSDTTTERITREVLGLRQAKLDESVFELPGDYAETEFLAPAPAGTPEQGPPTAPEAGGTPVSGETPAAKDGVTARDPEALSEVRRSSGADMLQYAVPRF